MTFCPDDAPVAVAPRSDKVLLRPLRAANVDRDQAAAVASQEALPQGSGGEGPRPSN